MKKTVFVVNIKASKEKVWETLWNDETYRKWTAVFAPDSHAVSDWKQGSEIKFIDGTGDGIYSIIETNKPFEQMSFKHLGEIKNAIKTNSDWNGAMENYFLKESNGVVELKIVIDLNKEFEKYFNDTFPKAVHIIKQLSENKY